MSRSIPARAVSLASLFLVVACGGLVEEDPSLHEVRVSPKEVGRRDASAPTHLESEAPVTPAHAETCPETEPSEEHWCPKPHAVCLYTDHCSQRPQTAPPTHNYQCTASRWTRINGRYPVACPSTLPATDSPCETACDYEPCAYETACGTTTVVCDRRTGTWQLNDACAAAAPQASADGDAGTR